MTSALPSALLQCREAHPNDQKTIVEFQLAMALETERLTLNLETCTLGVAAVFKNPGLGHYFVAEREGQIVGSLLIIPEWSDWRNAMVWWIHSVYIIPDARQQGIFKFMYGFIKQQGQQNQIRGLRLYVDRTNLNAQAVYKRLGMSNDHYDLFEWMT
jgi:GNAT superfamily N-acetyltransferase